MQEITYEIVFAGEQKHWWYRVRRALIKDLIKTHSSSLNVRPKILDVGCGTGELLKELSEIGDCFGVDFSSSAIDFCKQRGLEQVKQGDAVAIPYESGSFDVVLCLDVLEHIPDDTLAIQELKRVLKKDGTLIIFVPAFKFLWGKSDEIGNHYRRYTLSQLVSKFKKENFTIMKKSYFNFFLFFPIWLIRFLIRIFKISVQSENSPGPQWVNSLLYRIFRLEILLLRSINFPFGVSAMIVCKK